MDLWLARVRLDERHRIVRYDLADVVDLHRRVMSLFPDSLGDRARRHGDVLFRLDDTPAGHCLLIQSRIKPDPHRLPEGYCGWDTRQLSPLLDALRAGTPVHYRIAANASKRLAKDDGARRKGQVVALAGAEAGSWWHRRATAAGLALTTGSTRPLDTVSGKRSGGEHVRHAVTLFEGAAVVTEPDAARAAVVEGIGRGRSYGCGLLSLAPVATS